MTLEHVDTVFAFSVVMLLFSMVITVLVQMVVAISGLRGRNLIWGVTKVLERSPDLREHAASIANAALTHPAVTVSRRPAATIGSSELMAVLRDLADPSNPSLGDQASKALTEALERTVPEASRVHAEKLVDQFNELFPDESRRMQEAVRVLRSKAGQLTNDFDSWFDTIMNRTTDRFILHTRAWTIVFAILIAFVLHIDSPQLIRQLSTDAEMRASLIDMADRTLARSEALLEADSVAVRALVAIGDEYPEEFDGDVPTSVVSRGQGQDWIERTFPQDPPQKLLVARYEEEFDRLTRERLGELRTEAGALKEDLEESRLVILSGELPGLEEYARWRHLLGVLISASLLALGAPFWFNALRTLASLRPILAGQTDPSKKSR